MSPVPQTFADWGRLVSYIHSRDPNHLAYINLFPMYATNAQLGTSGDPVTAYNAYLSQYVSTVQRAPASLISYDHYQLTDNGRHGAVPAKPGVGQPGREAGRNAVHEYRSSCA